MGLRLFGAGVLAPAIWRWRFGAGVLALSLFGAETVWRRDCLAPVILAPSLFGAGRFGAASRDYLSQHTYLHDSCCFHHY